MKEVLLFWKSLDPIVQSVAEHATMTMLILLRIIIEGHAQATTKGTWDIAAVAKDEFDMEGKVFCHYWCW